LACGLWTNEVSASDRHPLWPTELKQVGAPLEDPDTYSDAERLAAVRRLEAYATPVILPYVDLALEDPAVGVQRWALELCLARQLVRCDQTAKRLWEEGQQASLRTTAISVLALDPVPERAEILFDALREDGELMRAHAAFLIGQAPLDEPTRLRARRVLATKLADASARVRRSAATSLGRLGPGEGALALVRLLDDPDLAVRESAAQALGALEDPRAAAPLKRVLENAPSDQVARKSLDALARIPDPSIDALLLSFLDAPPSNLPRSTVVKAIGKRRQASPELLEGLVDRLRESDIRSDALRALRWQGDAAVPALERASKRGLEPSLRLEVDRLLAARRLHEGEASRGAPDQAVAPTVEVLGSEADLRIPGTEDRRGWERATAGSQSALLANELAAASAPWAPAGARGAIRRAADAEQAEAWLIWLALSEPGVLGQPRDAFTWTRVIGWARDSAAPTPSRCLAAWALAGAAETRHEDWVRHELGSLSGSRSPRLRACVATALGAHSNTHELEALLHDLDARVRAAAAMAFAQRGRNSTTTAQRSQLAIMADTDAAPQVRQLARWAGSREDRFARLRLVRTLDHGSWIGIEVDGVELDVPTVSSAGRTLGLAAATEFTLRTAQHRTEARVVPTQELLLRGLH
jgi:HEAT repeat protein